MYTPRVWKRRLKREEEKEERWENKERYMLNGRREKTIDETVTRVEDHEVGCVLESFALYNF
jgi:hypothetical protein